MTIRELIDKLSAIGNDEVKDFPIEINGTYNWEYITELTLCHKVLVIETTDLKDF